MKTIFAFSLFVIFSLTLSAVPCLSADFFYIVQQWPGSSCVANNGCCYPANKKPVKDFAIAGLWPAVNNISDIRHFCNSNTVFPIAETSNLTKSLNTHWPLLTCPARDERTLWAAEWREYGTCSGLKLNQYFSRAISLKKENNLLKAFASAGIKPDGRRYNTGDFFFAIVKIGKRPALLCNKDKSGKSQLYQVVFCVNGKEYIDCPAIPQANTCAGVIKFPSF